MLVKPVPSLYFFPLCIISTRHWWSLEEFYTGCPAKKYIRLKTFVFEKVWNKFKHYFHGCKIIHCLHLEVFIMTKYLETLFNYNLISNWCQFLMTSINRTRVLVVIVMFKAPWRNNNSNFFFHNNGAFIVSS